MEMIKEKKLKEDGRYIIFYQFKEENNMPAGEEEKKDVDASN